MDGERFDAITRIFGRGLSRRQFAAAAGAALIGATGPGRLALAAKCRPPGGTCRKSGDCCSGVCSEKDAHGRQQCLCPAGTEACGRTCVDPASTYLSDPANCGACGNVCQRTRCGVAACVNGACSVGPDPRKVGRSCDDGNGCTEGDICQPDGSCAGTPKNCSVNEPRCQSATCNPATGQCETTNLPLGTACANDNRCDGDEACDGQGVCAAGTPVVCTQPGDPCKSSVCDAATGQCVTSNAQDGVGCVVDFIPSGVCCGGICSQCCNDASACASLFAEKENVALSCQDPAVVGDLNCTSQCDPETIPANTPVCTNPAVMAGVNQLCLVDGQSIPCLYCRLPVGSQCSANTQCCGFCVNGTCQDGAAGSPCVDGSGCASGLNCSGLGVCTAPLAIQTACDPANDLCASGTSCGAIIGSGGNTFCCLPLDAACSDDGDCCQNGGVQDRCVLGVCKTRGSAGAACGKDFDCAGALTCVAGTCGSKSPVGGTCDSAGDCAFDVTSNSQPICANGTCGLANGSATTGSSSCASGTSVQCTYGTICGECCTTDSTGYDPDFCGDLQSEKLCCNHTCVYRNNTEHCGACNVDCTCGGEDPYRYCKRVSQTDVPSWDWPAICAGYYDANSGHCANNGDFCSTNCVPSPPCDCTQPVNSLFCYASCVGAFPNLELSTCAAVGEACLAGHDNTCCGETVTCQQSGNCSVGTVFCLSEDSTCVAA